MNSTNTATFLVESSSSKTQVYDVGFNICLFITFNC